MEETKFALGVVEVCAFARRAAPHVYVTRTQHVHVHAHVHAHVHVHVHVHAPVAWSTFWRVAFAVVRYLLRSGREFISYPGIG